jgi:hypothetical protein
LKHRDTWLHGLQSARISLFLIGDICACDGGCERAVDEKTAFESSPNPLVINKSDSEQSINDEIPEEYHHSFELFLAIVP